jgi:hypothetical protein
MSNKKKTTLRQLISQINFDDKSVQGTPNWETLANIFNIFDLYYSDDERLKCYFIKKWYCTDSYVGMRAYFLDGNLVAISSQIGRKMDEEFHFMSDEYAKIVKTYLQSLVEPIEDIKNYDIINENSLDEEIPETFKIQYNTQILHKTALLNGERVEIIKSRYSWDDKENYFHTIKIKKYDGTTIEIDCRELDFEYNV